MADTTPSFDDLFAGGQQQVDFSAPEGGIAAVLPVPDETDNLQTTARKLAALAAIVERGKSLAVHTGYAGAAHATRDPVDLAKTSMTPAEVKQYETWARGIRMPEFNFVTNREPLRGQEGARKRYERRARAMNKIWKTNVAVAENAMFVSIHLTYMVPLVAAVSKIEAAEMELVGGSNDLTEMELAEVQTAHKITSIASANMNSMMEQIRRLTSSINSSKEIIQAREHAIKRKIQGYKPKKDPINDARQYLGEAPIGDEVDYRGATRGAREDRTDMLGGILGGTNQGALGGGPSNPQIQRQARATGARPTAPPVEKRARRTGPTREDIEMEY
ncbi:hypothetical protein [Cryphonectria parasitica bipartite mycovirus 1]|uniref:hypothetical protein n=1 Tax=Cryphonectria parasitica bipartite mycovirus 1 TaxID=1329781 RepID=UPI00032A48B9|nr:hypothetical protein [Cryphonectria parasitica bipartite mycovirus 1]AGK89732.1 hypothetical protein [Cryphonectria parasitica bipartite mycovirus 1]